MSGRGKSVPDRLRYRHHAACGTDVRQDLLRVVEVRTAQGRVPSGRGSAFQTAGHPMAAPLDFVVYAVLPWTTLFLTFQ
jgi:hypothetical protein